MEESETPSPASLSATSVSSSATDNAQSSQSAKVQKPTDSQCNTRSTTPSQNVAPTIGAQVQTPSVITYVPVESGPTTKPESKPLQGIAKEFRPRPEIQTIPTVEDQQHNAVPVSISQVTAPVESVAEVPVSVPIAPPTVIQSERTIASVVASRPLGSTPTPLFETPKIPTVGAGSAAPAAFTAPPATARSNENSNRSAANAARSTRGSAPFPGPIPSRPRAPLIAGTSSDFPQLAGRNTIHGTQQTPAGPVAPIAVANPSASNVAQVATGDKERKVSERSTGSSRGTTPPTPLHNQTEQPHQRSNGETTSDASSEASYQRSADGELVLLIFKRSSHFTRPKN